MAGDPDPSEHEGPSFSAAEDRSGGAAVGTAAFVLSLRARGIRDTGVLRAMELVPREVFAPRRFADLARTDVALPLPCGQTMTAPHTVAVMLVALGAGEGQRVLEVGTGSGYVAAVLARLGGRVLSVERFATLAESAAEHLRIVGARNVRVEVGDGLAQRPRERFDRILLNGTAAAIPDTVTALLGPGGRLVGAVSVDGAPRLATLERLEDGSLSQQLGGRLRLSPLASGVARAL